MVATLHNDMFDSLRLELRRGCLILAVLAQLRVEHYGYTLRKALADEGSRSRRARCIRCCGGWRRKGC